MRQKYRQFLSYLLLATYAGISLVGDGLHSLVPHGDHHHHHGIHVAGHSCHGHHHGDHDHDHGASHCCDSEFAEIAATDGDADSHVCEICEFIVQAIGQPVEIAAPVVSRPLVVLMHAEPQPIYSPTSLGPQAPRGPPVLSA